MGKHDTFFEKNLKKPNWINLAAFTKLIQTGK